MAELVAPHADGLKVGLELLMAAGSTIVATIADVGIPVFVDAKLHDIPNTVGHAAGALGRLGARWVTVHGSGGASMMSAAVEGLASTSSGKGGILAVTVLTSLNEADLASIGVGEGIERQVGRLAALAASCGVEGIVASVHECRRVRESAPGLKIFTPGIRPGGTPDHDQARVATPAEGVRQGADFLVVGRAITRHPDPAAAASSIAAEIHAGETA